MKKYIVVEIYDPKNIGGHKPGWRYEVFDNKNEIPQEYFDQDEMHAFWRFSAINRNDAVKKFLAAISKNTGEGLLWTYDKQKM